MLSVGAGIYEELLFRVVLVTGLAWLGQAVLGWRPALAGLWATLLGAMLFSAAHYVGPYGDALTLYSFVFRMIAASSAGCICCGIRHHCMDVRPVRPDTARRTNLTPRASLPLPDPPRRCSAAPWHQNHVHHVHVLRRLPRR
jgi:hypothetical protein